MTDCPCDGEMRVTIVYCGDERVPLETPYELCPACRFRWGR